jgi:virginiamycin B lyase
VLPTAPCTFSYSITACPDGNLWFAPSFAEQLGVVSTNGVVSTSGALSSQKAITIRPDGNMPTAGLTSLRSFRASITNAGQYPATPSAYDLPGITRGPDNNLWFLEQYSNNGPQVARISTRGVVPAFPLPTPNALPRGIAAGPDGNIWFTENYANNVAVLVISGGRAYR